MSESEKKEGKIKVNSSAFRREFAATAAQSAGVAFGVSLGFGLVQGLGALYKVLRSRKRETSDE